MSVKPDMFKNTNMERHIFPGGSVVKNPPANAGDIRDMGLILGL